MKEIKYNGEIVGTLITEKDIDFTLEGETVVVLGYGSHGQGQSLCLKDSGVEVIIGVRKGKSWQKAVKDGWIEGKTLLLVNEAVKKGTIICMHLPDTVQDKVYEEIKPFLKPNMALCFAHGYNIAFNKIKPSEHIDVFMVAPKGPGQMVRKEYLNNFGLPGLIAVHQDYSGKAKERTLAFAKAIGCARPGLFETTFEEETISDLFGEQVAFGGALVEITRHAFDILVEAGYNPIVAYWEVMHELFGILAPLCFNFGPAGMLSRVSDTMKDGVINHSPDLIDTSLREKMQGILTNIENANYSKEWTQRYNDRGREEIKGFLSKLKNHKSEVIGKQIRQAMWPGRDEY